MSDFTGIAILVLCFYPVLPIVAALMANEAKAKKNIVIGCTLPFTAQHDPRGSTTRGWRRSAASTKSGSGAGFSS